MAESRVRGLRLSLEGASATFSGSALNNCVPLCKRLIKLCEKLN